MLGGQRQELLKDVDSPVVSAPDGRRFAFTRGIPEQSRVRMRLRLPTGPKITSLRCYLRQCRDTNLAARGHRTAGR